MHLSGETFGLNPLVWVFLVPKAKQGSLPSFNGTILLPLTLNSGRGTLSAFSRAGSDPWLTMHRYAEFI